MWKFVFLMVLAMGVSASMNSEDNVVRRKRIVGGEPAAKTEEYTVAIATETKTYCSGVLVDKSWVLTSGNCAYLMEPGILSVFAESAIGPVEKVIIHPKFDYWLLYNDLALMKLKVPAALPTVKWPPGQGDIKPGDVCTVSGWGYTHEDGAMSTALMKLEVNIVSDEDCADYYAAYGDFVSKSFTCAGWVQGEKGTCEGDIGGPLVCNKELKGILSWGEGCARPNRTGVYTEIAPYHSWIQDTMKTK